MNLPTVAQKSTLTHIDAADRLLYHISGCLLEARIKAKNGRGDWSDSGSMAHVQEQLRDIARFLKVENIDWYEKNGESAIDTIRKAKEI